MTSTEQQVFDFYKSKGLSNNAIYGIMGNIAVESEFKTNVTGDNGTSYGLFQWHNERWEGLKKFAQEKGTDISDLNTQLEYSWAELNSTEKKALNMLQNNKLTVRQYAEKFDKIYERSTGVHTEQRVKYAQEYYKGSSFFDRVASANDRMNQAYVQGEVITSDDNLISEVVRLVMLVLVCIACVIFFAMSIGAFDEIKKIGGAAHGK